MIQLSRGGLELGPGRLLGGLVYGVSLLGLPVWCSVSRFIFTGAFLVVFHSTVRSLRSTVMFLQRVCMMDLLKRRTPLLMMLRGPV